MKFYPKAHHDRPPLSDPALRSSRISFFKAAGLNFLLLQILFLGLFSYIYGAIFVQSSHVHNLRVLFVDYDGGEIGTSVRDAYSSLRGPSFPSLIERQADEFPTPEDLEHTVCRARYWAAVYVSPGASVRLQTALRGGEAAATYNKSDVLSFIWNEARYSATVDSLIAQNVEVLSSSARLAYYTNSNGTGELQTLLASNNTDATGTAAAVSVFTDPWHIASLNIQPTTQGSRLIYNTLVIILIMIQEFFYLGTVNGLYVQFRIYSRLSPHRIIIVRILISLAYTFIGSLCTAGAIWAFRSGWQVNANQFALTWAALWLFAHANFLSLDVMTIWLPLPFVPMALIAWIVLNVTSILVPFELSPGFYRWAYAMPAHEVYQTITDIWSRGCNPKLSYSLPVLFAVEVIGLVLSAIGVYRRCHYAVLAEEAQEEAFRARLDAAMAFQRERDEERKEKERKEKREIEESNVAGGNIPTIDNISEIEEAEEIEKEREELADVIRREDDILRREESRVSRNFSFGPAFDLAVGERGSG